MLFLPLALALTQAASPTTVEGIVVEGAQDGRLTVTVTGDIPAETIVRSEPVGIRCGVARHTYDPYGAPRLCWFRKPGGTPVHLRVEGMQALGAGWTVQWTGCEPDADGLGCTLEAPRYAAEVRAAFQRR